MPTLDYIHARYARDLYKDLEKEKIGTTNVVSLCTRLCKTLPISRRNTLVSTIINWKMADANKRLKEEQYNNTKVWRESKKLLGDFNMIESYEIEWSKERERYKQCLTKKRKKKIVFLMNKYGKKREIPDTTDGIIIKYQIITEDFSSEPRVYGNITINENERSILILPPNYVVMEKVSETKCQVEVEKGLAKLDGRDNKVTTI